MYFDQNNFREFDLLMRMIILCIQHDVKYVSKDRSDQARVKHEVIHIICQPIIMTSFIEFIVQL